MRVNGKYTQLPDYAAFNFIRTLRQMTEVVNKMNSDYRDMRISGILSEEAPFRTKMPDALDKFADAAEEVANTVEEALDKASKDVGEVSGAPADLMVAIEQFRIAAKNLPRLNDGLNFGGGK